MTEKEIEDWKESVAYFWLYRGDPERYTGWDEAVCAKVWPEFWLAWQQYEAAKRLLSTVARGHRDSQSAKERAENCGLG